MEVVKNLDKSFLEAGGVDVASSLFRLWSETDGLFPESLARYSPHLLFNACEIEDGELPKILFIGNETLLSKLHGADYFSPSNTLREIPSPAMIHAAKDGYLNALSGEPTYDFVSMPMRHPERDPIELSYERLILPARTKSFDFLVTLCVPTSGHHLIDQSNQECQRRYWIPATCSPAGMPDYSHSPNVSLWDAGERIRGLLQSPLSSPRYG